MYYHDWSYNISIYYGNPSTGFPHYRLGQIHVYILDSLRAYFQFFIGSSHSTQIKLYCILRVRLSSTILNSYYCCNVETHVSNFYMSVPNSLFKSDCKINIIIVIAVKFSHIAKNEDRSSKRSIPSVCHILIVDNRRVTDELQWNWIKRALWRYFI